MFKRSKKSIMGIPGPFLKPMEIAEIADFSSRRAQNGSKWLLRAVRSQFSAISIGLRNGPGMPIIDFWNV